MHGHDQGPDWNREDHGLDAKSVRGLATCAEEAQLNRLSTVEPFDDSNSTRKSNKNVKETDQKILLWGAGVNVAW